MARCALSFWNVRLMKRDVLPAAHTSSALPVQPISQDVLAEKYLKDGEKTEAELFARVARALASVEKPEIRDEWEAKFLGNLHAGAIGAGRIMSAAGTDIQATLINCFVQPVGDCIQGYDDQGYPGIYEALREAAETMRRGGGVGYDFSRIRPNGAEVKGTHSIASGPCSYINVFDQSCATVESAGSRRGAQMGVLRIDHPDVLDFITAKRTPGRWNNFNVSVGVTDAFMKALQDNADWELVHRARPGRKVMAAGAYQRDDGKWVYRRVPARQLWDTIMKSTYDFAEPGILFLDAIGRDNNLNYCETIEATNPCGEQPLPPYGCCDLGPIILTRFVRNAFGQGGEPSFDFAAFEDVVAIQVRALDNVLDVTFWPLDKQRAEAAAKRRIGVGFTGLGNTLAMLKLRYDRAEGRAMAARIAETMRNAAYRASVELAKEKGAFPQFDADRYLGKGSKKGEGSFASRLPDDIKADIRKYGIRNSHLLSIAPTGTVSLAFADNASNGIEPPFSWTYTRRKREADGSRSEYVVEDHAWRLFKSQGALNAVAEKIEYWTHEGQQRLYLIVSFLPVEGTDGRTVERAIEFFMPVGQSGESQQWITATMRMLSLAARGGFLDRALSDMRKVTWDRGPVRLGTYEKADGTHVPRWHDSEVAAIAYAIQNLIAKRQEAVQASLFEPGELPSVEPAVQAAPESSGIMAGKKCSECGAYAMIRKDGCDYCTQCGMLGSCG